jgi:16S rRNA (cytidine1402-2'-O)-methyltransferase
MYHSKKLAGQSTGPEAGANGPGSLYIVATPIGNLEDVTLRAIKVLKEVHLIAAEDTRRTKKLLQACQIATPLTSLFEHNELKKSGALIAKILAGADVAYVSDAGTPGISDPGYLLIQEALAHDINIISIPGACAAIAALSISGLPTDSFVFHGFLPAKAGKRQHFIKSLADETKTMIFYESPHRLIATLQDLLAVLGNRRVAVSRELTKIYEETARGTLSQIIDVWCGRVLKGEITLVVAGKDKSDAPCSEGDIQELLQRHKESTELPERALIEKIAQETGAPRKMVYRVVMKAKGSI